MAPCTFLFYCLLFVRSTRIKFFNKFEKKEHKVKLTPNCVWGGGKAKHFKVQIQIKLGSDLSKTDPFLYTFGSVYFNQIASNFLTYHKWYVRKLMCNIWRIITHFLSESDISLFLFKTLECLALPDYQTQFDINSLLCSFLVKRTVGRRRPQ